MEIIILVQAVFLGSISGQLWTTSAGDGELALSDKLYKFYEVPADCQTITEFNNEQVHQKISRVLQKSQMSKVWLPMRRVELVGGWHWYDGEYYGKRISAKEWENPGMDCAVLRSLDKIIDDVYCDRKYEYYMCQGKQDPRAYLSLGLENVTYNIYKKSGTWFDAANGCHAQGQTLASFAKGRLKKAFDIIAQKTGKWANIWIGLSKKVFRFNNSQSQNVEIFKWDDNEPARSEWKDCVVAYSKNGFTAWKLEFCNSTHSHLCVVESVSVSLIPEKIQENKHNTSCISPFGYSSKDIWILVLVITLIIVVLYAAVLTIRICCKQSENRQTGEKEAYQTKKDDLSNRPTEKESLLPDQNRNVKSRTEMATTKHHIEAGAREDDVNLPLQDNENKEKPTSISTGEDEKITDVAPAEGVPTTSVSTENTDDTTWAVKYFPLLMTMTPDFFSSSFLCSLSIDTSSSDQPAIRLKRHENSDSKFKDTSTPISTSGTFNLRQTEGAIDWSEKLKSGAVVKRKVILNTQDEAEELFAIITRIQTSPAEIKDDVNGEKVTLKEDDDTCSSTKRDHMGPDVMIGDENLGHPLYKGDVKVTSPLGLTEKEGETNTLKTELLLQKNSQGECFVSIGTIYIRRVDSVHFRRGTNSKVTK